MTLSTLSMHKYNYVLVAKCSHVSCLKPAQKNKCIISILASLYSTFRDIHKEIMHKSYVYVFDFKLNYIFIKEN